MFATSSEGLPSVASTATDPAMSLTRSPVTSSKSRLVGDSMVHCVIAAVLPVSSPVTPKRYISFAQSQDISRRARAHRNEKHPGSSAPTGVRHDHEDPVRTDCQVFMIMKTLRMSGA